MIIIHKYEGGNTPFIEIEVKKNNELKYFNNITSLPLFGPYEDCVVGVWNIKWKKLKIGVSCDEQKENWILPSKKRTTTNETSYEVRNV